MTCRRICLALAICLFTFKVEGSLIGDAGEVSLDESTLAITAEEPESEQISSGVDAFADIDDEMAEEAGQPQEPVVPYEEDDDEQAAQDTKKEDLSEDKGPERLIPNVATTLTEFEEFLDNHESTVVKFFQDPKIDPPSEAMVEIDEALYSKYSDRLAFINVNGKEHPEISRTYKIEQTPTYLFFKRGHELAQRIEESFYPLRITELTDASTLEAHIIKLLQTPAPVSDKELEQALDALEREGTVTSEQ